MISEEEHVNLWREELDKFIAHKNRVRIFLLLLAAFTICLTIVSITLSFHPILIAINSVCAFVNLVLYIKEYRMMTKFLKTIDFQEFMIRNMYQVKKMISETGLLDLMRERKKKQDDENDRLK